MADRTQTVERPRPVEVTMPKRIFLRTLAWVMPIIFMALLGLGILIALAITPESAPAVQPFDTTQGEPEQQTDIIPVDNPPAESDSAPAQDVQPSEPDAGTVGYAPLPVVEPTTLVEWGMFAGDPQLSLTEETYFGWKVVPFSSSPTENGIALAQYILPELQGFVQDWHGDSLDGGSAPVWLSIDRDGKYIFAAIKVHDSRRVVEASLRSEEPDPTTIVDRVYFFLSSDDGESWHAINPFLIQRPTTGEWIETPNAGAAGIKVERDILTLYVQHLPYQWHDATINLKDLPR